MKLVLQSIRQLLLWTLVTGVMYPLVMTIACQALFPRQAAGSLVWRDGKVVGSVFIAQQFSGANYFWPRPSAGNASPVAGAPNAYATAPSGASNLGPTSASLQSNVQGFAKALREAHKLPADAPVPADLITTSASGLDPEISPEAARFQVARVAAARGLAVDRVSALVEKSIQPRQWGFLGEPRVNVLLLNLALDQAAPPAPKG